MGRRKYEPTRDGNVNVVSIEERENGVCDNKLFYANRIKTLRSLAHFTQAELASLLGVSRTAVFNWETGRSRPDITNIPALFLLERGFGANGIAWAQPVADVISMLLVVVLFAVTFKKSELNRY